MEKIVTKSDMTPEEGPILPVVPVPVGRRLFLRYAGIATASTAILASCTNNLVEPGATSPKGAAREGDVIDLGDLGSNDIAVLNYAYALEQLEAAFYTMAVANPFSGITAKERMILTQIRDHEVAHRDFFKAALGSKAIPGLTPDFSAINFSDRASVLGTAKVFEDLGVSAYNGAGRLIQGADYLTIAGKIVSVEARHAATIRELLNPKTASFAGDDIIDPATGLEMSRLPNQVLPLAQPFIKERITARVVL